MNHKRVFGVFPSHKEASIAVEKLLSMGYDAKDISLISKNTEGREIPKEDPTATEAGVKGGTLTGVTVGGVAGLLAGLGVLAIPGIGPLLVAGPIAATLSGVIAGGTLGGTIGLLGGAIVDATVSEEEARYLDERFQAGDVIVYLDVHEDRFEEVLPHLTNAHRDQKRQLEHHVEPSEPLDLPKEPALEEVPQDLPKEAFEPVPKKEGDLLEQRPPLESEVALKKEDHEPSEDPREPNPRPHLEDLDVYGERSYDLEDKK